MSLRENATRFQAKQRKHKHHKQKRQRRSACSPKELIKNRSVRRTKLRLEQIGAGVFQFRGQDVRQKIEKSIAFWRRLAKSHIEASRATDGTLDRSAAAAALLYRLQVIECSLLVGNLYGAVYNCLLTFTYVHQFTIIDNEPAIVAGQASIDGARRGGTLRFAGIITRDREMAQEFQNRKGGRTSDTALMEKIGKDRKLKRSASINAIKRGLKDLKRRD